MFTDNAFVTILLCSSIGVKNDNYKPFTALQWSGLVVKIINSAVKEPSRLLNMSPREIVEVLLVSLEDAERICSLLSRGANVALAMESFERKGIKVVTRSDKHYPKRLKSVLKKNAPPVLYYCGDISLANYKGIAIVGSRDIDESGNRFAEKLASKAVDERLIVYSGGARGVDGISEKAALDKGGRVVSVIADSLAERIKKREIRSYITDGKLLLLTAVNPDAAFSPASAMNRNKYVYALSSGAFIVASDYNKGGTWAGATDNIKNKWVNSYVWDNGNYKGNGELIKLGATAIDSALDISIKELIDQ